MISQLTYLQSLSDAKLVKLFLAGVRRAFDVLVSRHNAHLKQYLHALMHNASMEEEVLQTLWVKVMDDLGRHSYHERGHFDKWINTQLYWLYKKFLRSERHFLYESDAGIPDEPVTMDEEETANEEKIAFFKKHIPLLRPIEQEIIHLRLDENMLFKDIDVELHLRPHESNIMFTRAMKRLHKLFNTDFRD